MKKLLIPLIFLSAAAFGQVGPFVMTATTSPCAQIGIGAKGSQVAIVVSGTFSATLQPELSVQGQAAANTQVTPSTSSTAASTITAAGTYFTVNVAGADTFLLCPTGFVSGTATVYLNISTAGSASKGGGGGAPSGSAGGDLSGTYPNPTVVNINGTAFSGTSGHLVSFGAANIPADSGVVAANAVTASSPGAGLCHFAGSTQACTSSAVVGADLGAALTMNQSNVSTVWTTRMTSNYTSAGNGPDDLAGLAITLPGSTAATYAVDCYGQYSQATTGTAQQLSFQSVTTAATRIDANMIAGNAVGTFRGGGNSVTSPNTSSTQFGTSFTTGSTAVVLPWQAHITIVQPSGTASIFKIQWSSTTGATDVTTVYAGSRCAVTATAN